MIVAHKVSRFVLAFGCWMGLHLSSASAGAFLLEPGQWQVISTIRNSVSAARYDDKGVLSLEKRYGKTQATSLIEYGLTADLTLLMSPAVRFLRAQGPPDLRGVGIGSMDFGARWKIYELERQIVSFQALTRLPARSDPLFRSENRASTELRLGYGRNDLLFRGRDAFLDAGLVWAKRDEPWRDEIRADLTFGWQRWPGRLVLIQWNYSAYPGAVGESRMPRQFKIETSTVTDIGEGWALQMGTFMSHGGVATRFERGNIIGLWRKF